MRRLAVLAAIGLALPAALSLDASPLAAARVDASLGSAPRAEPALAFDAAFVRGSTEAQRLASYRRLHALGVRVIRLDFRWVDLERIGRPLHRYAWGRQDREVRTIHRAGLTVLGILGYGHPNYSRAGWAAYRRGQKPSGPFGVGDPQYYPPDDPRSFARFAADVARRYRSGVVGWEIWNEENQGWRFWEPKEDPRAYARLLCAAHAALGHVDPGVPVLFGGLFFPPLGGLVGTGGARFLDEVLVRGGAHVATCFDAVAYHPYPYPFTSPEAAVGDRGSVLSALDQLRAVLSRHRLGSVPLWNTEVGWPTNPLGNGVTEARQARYAARLQLFSWRQGLRLLTWYTWGDAPDPSGRNQEAHFGFFRADGTPKPVFHALVVLRRELGRPGWRFAADRSRRLGLPRGRRGVGEGFALQFAGPAHRHVLALWYANERPPPSNSPFASVEPGTPPETIGVSLRLPTGASVVGMLGQRMLGPLARARRMTLHVGQDPLYVIWRGTPAL